MKNRARFTITGIVLFCLGGAGWGTALAAGGATEGSGDRWSSELYLYLWASSLNGTAAVRGNEAEVDEGFSDLVKNLGGAFSARLESHKGSFGYFLDAKYVNLDPSMNTPTGTIKVENKQWILAGGAPTTSVPFCRRCSASATRTSMWN